MNYLSDVLDSLPVVGHTKALVHYVTGNKDAGHKALYHSTRSSAVVAGWTLGSLAGPPAAFGAGIFAGSVSDLLVSIIAEKPVGLVHNVADVIEDIEEGTSTTVSVIRAGAALGLDGAGGGFLVKAPFNL